MFCSYCCFRESSFCNLRSSEQNCEHAPKKCSQKSNFHLSKVTQLPSGRKLHLSSSPIVTGPFWFLLNAHWRSFLWRMTPFWSSTSVASPIYQLQISHGSLFLFVPLSPLVIDHSMSTLSLSWWPRFHSICPPVIIQGKKTSGSCLAKGSFWSPPGSNGYLASHPCASSPFLNNSSLADCFQDTLMGQDGISSTVS